MNEQLDLILDTVDAWQSKFDDGTYPADFWPWLKENREVLNKFAQIALRARAKGFDHWSARAVLHVLRWETAVREAGQEHLKINNNASPGLARLAGKLYPDLAGFFSTRMPPNTNHGRRLIDGELYSHDQGGDA